MPSPRGDIPRALRQDVHMRYGSGIARFFGSCFFGLLSVLVVTPGAEATGFKEVRGFGVIHMDTRLPQVQAALSKARVPHEFRHLHKSGDVLITFKTGPERPSSAGGKWEATIYFGDQDRVRAR